MHSVDSLSLLLPSTPREGPGTPSLDPRTLQDMLDYRLYLVYRAYGDHFERMLNSEFGLNRRRWRFIATVHALEGATLSEIASHAETDRAQASRTIGTMVREGYFKRLSHPENARFAKIIFTDKGRDLHDRILARYRDLNISMVDSLTVDEVHLLDALLEKLRLSGMRAGISH